jgi:hypothetical protein
VLAFARRYEEYHLEVKFLHPGEHDGLGVDTQTVFYTKFTMTFVNKMFTQWQIVWKIVFQVCTLIMMFCPATGPKSGGGYFWHLRKVPITNWTSLQIWLGAMLVMLFFFNDPFFPIEVFSESGVALAALYIIFLAIYMGVMMFFWLCVIHETSLQGGPDAGKPKTIGFYFAKAVFCTALVMVIAITYVRASERSEAKRSEASAKKN